MKFLGFCLSMIGLYVVYTGTVGIYNQTGGLHLGTTLFSILIATPFLALGAWASGRGQAQIQTERNLQAREVLESAASPPTAENRPAQDIALYLRPFKVDGVFVTDHRSMNIFNMDQYDRTGTDALERILGDAVARSYTTVSVASGNVEISGVGQVEKLENWQEDVSSLIDLSSIIFVTPLPSENTFWEIGEIVKTGALSRAVFIMPTQHSTVDPDFEVDSEWDNARQAIRTRIGLSLPRYDAGGGFFRFRDVDSAPDFVSANTGGSPNSVAKAINRLI